MPFTEKEPLPKAYGYEEFMAEDFAEKIGDAAGNADVAAMRTKAELILKTIGKADRHHTADDYRKYISAVPLQSIDGFLFVVRNSIVGIHTAALSINKLSAMTESGYAFSADFKPIYALDGLLILNGHKFVALETEFRHVFTQDGVEYHEVQALSITSPEMITTLLLSRKGDEYDVALEMRDSWIYIRSQASDEKHRAIARYLNMPETLSRYNDVLSAIENSSRGLNCVTFVGKHGDCRFWKDAATLLSEDENQCGIYSVPGIGFVFHNAVSDIRLKLFKNGRLDVQNVDAKALRKALIAADPSGKQCGRFPFAFGSSKLASGLVPDFPFFIKGSWKPLEQAGRILGKETIGSLHCTVRHLVNREFEDGSYGIKDIHTLTAEPIGPYQEKLSSFTVVLTRLGSDGYERINVSRELDEGIPLEALAYLFNAAKVSFEAHQHAGNDIYDLKSGRYLHSMDLLSFDRKNPDAPWGPRHEIRPGISQPNKSTVLRCDEWGRVSWILPLRSNLKTKPIMIARFCKEAFADLADHLTTLRRGLHASYKEIATANGYMIDGNGVVSKMTSSPMDEIRVETEAGTFKLVRDPDLGMLVSNIQFSWKAVPETGTPLVGSAGAIALAGEGELAVRVTPLSLRHLSYHCCDRSMAFEIMRAVALEAMRLSGYSIRERDLKRLKLAPEDLPEPEVVPVLGDAVVAIPGSQMSWVRDDRFWTLCEGLETIASFDPETDTLSGNIPATRLDGLLVAMPVIREHLAAA